MSFTYIVKNPMLGYPDQKTAALRLKSRSKKYLNNC